MDKTVLVRTDHENGAELLRALDKANLDIRAALWFYSPDSDDWRFIVASPLVDDKGPRETYRLVQSVLSEFPPDFGISLADISVVSPEDSLIRLLRTAITTPSDAISHIAFTRNTVNNVFIDEAYIYRLAPAHEEPAHKREPRR